MYLCNDTDRGRYRHPDTNLYHSYLIHHRSHNGLGSSLNLCLSLRDEWRRSAWAMTGLYDVTADNVRLSIAYSLLKLKSEYYRADQFCSIRVAIFISYWFPYSVLSIRRAYYFRIVVWYRQTHYRILAILQINLEIRLLPKLFVNTHIL